MFKCEHPVVNLYTRQCRKCGEQLRKAQCDHRRYAPWSKPEIVEKTRLWFVAEQQRQCLQCGYVLVRRRRVPRDNELSRSHVYEVDPGI